MSSSFEFPELIAPPPPVEVAVEAEAERREDAEAERLQAAGAEGFERGLAAGRAEIVAAVEALGAAATELGREREASAAATEQAAVELALQIAEKVLGAALEARPELVLDVVRGALRRLAEPQESVLLVNPEDVDLVRAAVEELAAEHGASLSVRAERRVPSGGCLVRTQAGEIDARVATQLQRAGAVVRAELGR
jgi:flagellar assembly protein FliH